MKILIIAPSFAPFLGVGAARMTSLSKYLSENGEQITVITQDEKFYPNGSIGRSIPDGVNIIKTTFSKSAKTVLKAAIFGELEKHQYDICIASFGSYEAVALMPEIKRKFNVPYILDFRDLWIFDINRAYHRSLLIRVKSLIKKVLSYPVERRAIKYSAETVTVTEDDGKTMKLAYRPYKDKIITIFNGYEPAIKTVDTTIKDDGKFTIGISGKSAYYNPAAAEMFLDTIYELNNGDSAKIEISRIGAPESEMSEILKKYEDKSFYHDYGYKEYKDAVRLMGQADVCLIIDGSKSGLGTKVFDYIGLNKPIIYIGLKDSELVRLLSQFEHVYICYDGESVKSAIMDIGKNNVSVLTNKDVHMFSREEQNRRYYDLIKKVAGR